MFEKGTEPDGRKFYKIYFENEEYFRIFIVKLPYGK